MKKYIVYTFFITWTGFVHSAEPEWLANLEIEQSYKETINNEVKTGLYKVNFNELDDAISGSLSGLPIKRLALYQNVADTLSEVMDSIVAPLKDLKETPLKVNDSNSNGVFDAGDSFEFFGTPTHAWRKVPTELQTSSPIFRYHTHSPYSVKRVYHLALKTTNGERFSSTSPYSGGGLISKVRTYNRIEKDSILADLYFNPSGIREYESGREWSWKMSEAGSSQSYNQDDFGWTNLNLETLVDSLYFQIEYQGRRNRQGVNNIFTSSFAQKQSHIALNLNWNLEDKGTFENNQPGGVLWSLGTQNLKSASWNVEELSALINDNEKQLEGITLSWLSNISAVKDRWFFIDNQLNSIKIENLSQNIIRVAAGVPTHLFEKGSSFSDSIGESDIAYFSIEKNKDLKPKITAVTQGLSGVISDLSTGKRADAKRESPEYLIISPAMFQEGAIDLKSYRENHPSDPIKTSVVLSEDIYRVMASDFDPAAIRNYIAYAKSTFAPNLKYVLLYGDGHYDYRNLKSHNLINPLPPFEDHDMVSDDYYTYIKSGDKLFWEGFNDAFVSPDLAIGRLPIRSISQGNLYLEKIKKYEIESLADFGPWRNRVLFLADDFQQLTNPDRVNHAPSVEKVYMAISEKRPDIESPRIYLLDYELDLSYKKPAAREEMIRSLNSGASFSVYFGHGGVEVISDENLFDKSAISQLSNEDRLNIFTAFSCTVGKWDAATVIPLSEEFLVGSAKGAIATISATRESFAGSNEALAIAFYSRIYSDTNQIRLGDALILAKKDLGNSATQRANAQRYNILGEPVLLWEAPKYEIKFNELPDTLKALDKIEFSGEVQGLSSGNIYLTFREQNIFRTWKDTIGSVAKSADAHVAGRVIHSEVVDVVNGRFKTEFISPRKLSFGDTSAIIQAYAWKANHKDYGSFFKSEIPIWGTSSYADSIKDSSAPEISFYTCEATGERQPLSSKSKLSLPLCIEVVIEDSTGLDYIENPDEGISYEILDFKKPSHPLFIEQTGKRAAFRIFLDEDVPEATYKIKVSARDILEQIGTDEIEVEVKGLLEANLFGVFNQPNPMSYKTKFFFQLGSSGFESAEIRIFSQSGKLVNILKEVISGETEWDGRDRWGNLLANGLYYYRVISKHSHFDSWNKTTQKESFSKLQKLVISR